MINYIIMLVIALGAYFAVKAVLRSAKTGGCVGCSSGNCHCEGSACCCGNLKNGKN